MLATAAGRPDAWLDTFVDGLSDRQREEARARADRFEAEASKKPAADAINRGP
jgi:hypothetical protein